jgi:hypothetical protein
MPSPAGWIVTVAVATHRRPILERSLSFRAPGSCSRAWRPVRRQYAHYEPGIDGRDWEVTKDRIGVSPEGRGPLPHMLGIRPFGRVGSDIGFSARRSFGEVGKNRRVTNSLPGFLEQA